MSDLVTVALIAAVPPTIAALCSLVINLKNRKEIRVLHEQNHEMHILMNSRLDELLKQSGHTAFAEGKAAGVEVERQEARARIEIKEAAAVDKAEGETK